MRIGWVATGGFDRSGRERVTPSRLWMLERLARRHDVVVFVLDGPAEPCEYELLGARVVDLGHNNGVRGLRLAGLHPRLSRAIRQQGPFDLLHGFWAVPGGLLAAWIAASEGTPSVVTFNSGEFVSHPDIGYGLQQSSRRRLPVWLAARLASRVTVCTEFMQQLASARGVSADLLPIGVDHSVLARPVTRSPGPPWRLLQVANLNPVKDQETLLDALTFVTQRCPDVHLDLVGVDTLDGRVQQRAAVLGLGEHVTFHGFKPTDEVADLYAQAHLYVQSSRHEAAGISVLEAAAAGVPVVGTAVGHLADLAPTAATAVPIRDPAALAEAIVRTLTDQMRRTRMAASARAFALAYDADWSADRMEELYVELVASSRAAASADL